MKYLKFLIFSISFSVSLNCFANDETPWAFNAPEAEGYTIKLIASDPLLGTPLVAGEEVQLKVSGSYSMNIARNGTITLGTQDETNNLVVPGFEFRVPE
jgi:hypothetical protein